MGVLLLVLIACVADYLYFKIRHTKADGPPTWYFFPFVGIAPFYGLPAFLFKPLFRYYLRNLPDVILTRCFHNPCALVKNAAIQDLQNSDHCLSRPAHGFETKVAKVTTGKQIWYVADNNSKDCPWQSIRKTNLLTLHVLPNEQKFRKIAECVDFFLKTIEDHEGKLWNYADDLTFAKLQEMSNLNLGKTFEVNNIQSFVKAMSTFTGGLSVVFFVGFVVPLRLIIWYERFLPKLLRPTFFGKMYAKMTRRIVEQKIGYVEQPRDFVEAALKLKEPEAAVEFLRDTVFFNMLATTHTTQHVTHAALTLVAIHKRVQQRIHRELDSVVGSAPLSYEHLANLHYLKATIHEASRVAGPLPKVLRMTTAPARLGGYTVESNMRLIMYLVSETVDPKYFSDPDAFIPERFLDDDGKFEGSKDFAIFSRGKRRCPGIDIANMSNMLYTTKILQHFEINLERNDIEVPRYSGSILADSAALPLRFVRRKGAPAIPPVVLNAGMTAFVKEIAEEEMANS